MPIPAWIEPLPPPPLNEGDQIIYDELIAIQSKDDNEDPEDCMRAIIGYINDNFIRRTNG